jgi:quinolinate synthase
MAVTAIDLQPYASLNDQDCDERVRRAKEKLGDRVVILGHHYQRDEVFKHADFSGDSLKLLREAANSAADYIVFCGVHFMAEVADSISRPEQVSILPDLSAGCAMADMADLNQVERAWRELSSVIDADECITPVTYINSAADLKSFCGKDGGIVCTSTNARNILDWSFEKREKVLFFPDQHLGRNTGFKMGIPLDDMVIWDYDMPMGGLTKEQIRNAKMILWKGF